MKFFGKGMLYLAGLTIAIINFSGCKDDDSTDPRTQKINELTATWSVNQVLNDNNDVTTQYQGFTLSINGLNYQTQNGGNPWPESGTYELEGDDLNTLLRSDGVSIQIDELSASTLILSFNFSEVATGRLDGVTGDFTFSMTK